MSNTLEILNPTRELKLASGAVVVRELPWKLQREAMDKIIAQITKLTQPGTGATAQVGGVNLSIEVVTAGIRESADLAAWLVEKTTGLPLEKIDELGVTEFFAILEHAIDLNVVGYITGAKKAFGRIGSFVAQNAAAPKAPATISPP
jgi:hypothetical protein